MRERLNRAVSKTVVPFGVPWVRIPPPPLTLAGGRRADTPERCLIVHPQRLAGLDAGRPPSLIRQPLERRDQPLVAGDAGTRELSVPGSPEGCPSGLRSAIGNRVGGISRLVGSNPTLSVSEDDVPARPRFQASLHIILAGRTSRPREPVAIVGMRRNCSALLRTPRAAPRPSPPGGGSGPAGRARRGSSLPLPLSGPRLRRRPSGCGRG